MSEAAVAGQTGERIALLKVLGPIHVWALGVGIVLVGESWDGISRLRKAARMGR